MRDSTKGNRRPAYLSGAVGGGTEEGSDEGSDYSMDFKER